MSGIPMNPTTIQAPRPLEPFHDRDIVRHAITKRVGFVVKIGFGDKSRFYVQLSNETVAMTNRSEWTIASDRATP